MTEHLNLGRPRTNPASGQSGTRTRDLRIASHSATRPSFLKRSRLRMGHCCRTALWDCFVAAIAPFIGYHEVIEETVSKFVQNSPIGFRNKLMTIRSFYFHPRKEKEKSTWIFENVTPKINLFRQAAVLFVQQLSPE